MNKVFLLQYTFSCQDLSTQILLLFTYYLPDKLRFSPGSALSLKFDLATYFLASPIPPEIVLVWEAL
jgi:hypothetical protein